MIADRSTKHTIVSLRLLRSLFPAWLLCLFNLVCPGRIDCHYSSRRRAVGNADRVGIGDSVLFLFAG